MGETPISVQLIKVGFKLNKSSLFFVQFLSVDF